MFHRIPDKLAAVEYFEFDDKKLLIQKLRDRLEVFKGLSNDKTRELKEKEIAYDKMKEFYSKNIGELQKKIVILERKNERLQNKVDALTAKYVK